MRLISYLVSSIKDYFEGPRAIIPKEGPYRKRIVRNGDAPKANYNIITIPGIEEIVKKNGDEPF